MIVNAIWIVIPSYVILRAARSISSAVAFQQRCLAPFNDANVIISTDTRKLTRWTAVYGVVSCCSSE